MGIKIILKRVAGLIVCALFLRACCFEIVRVRDNAMAPKLRDGDLVFINKLAYGLRVPAAGNYIWRWSPPRMGQYILTNEWSDPPSSVVRQIGRQPGDLLRPTGYSNHELTEGEYGLGFLDASSEPDLDIYLRGLARLRNISGRAEFIVLPRENKVESWWGNWLKPII